MQLPDFIAKMLDFSKKAETHFDATALLAAANAKIATLEAENATLKAASSDFDAKISVLTTDVATAKAATAAKETELKNVQAQLAKANTKAEDIITGQGLPPNQLPAAGTADAQGKQKENAWQKYQELSVSNPREAGAYWAAHADEILKSRPA